MPKYIKTICLLLLFSPTVSYAVAEDCTHGVSFDNSSTLKGVSGKVSCTRRGQKHIKTRVVGFKNGKKQGVSIIYDGYYHGGRPSNKIIIKEHYQNGKKQGKFIRYNRKTGKLESEAGYKNNLKLREINFHHDGSRTVSFSRQHPQYKTWTEGVGSLSYNRAGQLTDKTCPSKASGIAELDKVCRAKSITLYSGNGNVASRTNQAQKNKRVTKEFYPSGKIKHIRTAHTNKFFFQNGKVEEEIISTKKRGLITKNYYPTGQQKKLNRVQQRKLSEARMWYMNGKPKYVVLRQGNSNRMMVKTYYGNGQLEEQYTYIPRNHYSMFFSSFYRSAQVVGNSRSYHENGKIWEDTRRDNKGKIKSAKIYYENGKLKRSVQINTNKTRIVKAYKKDGHLDKVKSGTFYSDGSKK